MQDQNQKTQNTIPTVLTPQGASGAVAGQPVAGAPQVSATGATNAAQGAGNTGSAGQGMAQQKPQATQTVKAAPRNVPAQNPETSKATQDAFVRKIVDKIKNSENILVALSRDPSVDEMAAAIGLTLFLDSLQKHTTAIYSGETPDALRFLQPEGTFETNTDSLRDFIIALSKDKADHLRYKLDGDFVKVYITPYKTTLSEEDLEFSYGDFNVNLVLGLGIPSAGDLDEALSEHGRIMHDATTVDITVDVPGKFAEIEWSDPGASSVSEMVTRLIFAVQGKDAVLDKDVATALLTGIVAATGRFSNSRTNSETMQLASKLMSMGADQQLISAHVMDNEGNVPEVAEEKEADLSVDERVPAEADVEETAEAMPEMKTDTKVAESTIVEPVIPDLLKKQHQDRAAMQAAAAAAVNEAVSTVTANVAAAGATGVGIPQPQLPPTTGTQMQPVAEQPVAAPKDYAQMLEQALAEPSPMENAMNMSQMSQSGAPMPQMPMEQNVMGIGQPGIDQSGIGQPGMVGAIPQQPMMPGAPTVGAGAIPQQPAISSMPAAEPVANENGVVLPPPPVPTAGADSMPPVLPQVQMPGSQPASPTNNAGQADAFRIPGM